jgi:hypothetical protein
MNVAILGLSKIKMWVDAVWSVSALVCVPGLILTGGFWLAGGGSGGSIIGRLSEIHISHQHPQSAVRDFSIETEGAVVYKMRLVDVSGMTVYSYPEVITNSKEFGNLVVKMPQIKGGTYDLYADITYAKNPIRTNTVAVKMARVNVGE